MSNSLPSALCVAAFVVALVLPSQARAEEDFFEPAAMGMGGAVRNLGLDGSIVHLNPAGMTGKPRYIAGTNYSFYGREKSHTIASGAYDSRTSAFALGTEYTVWIFDPPFEPETDLAWFPSDEASSISDKRTWQRWDIAAAYGIANRRINVGVTARIVRQRYAIRTDRTFFTLDAGVTFYPVPFLVIGVSAQNLIPTKDSRFPVRLSPGVALELDDLLKVGFDVVFDFTSGDAMTTDLHGGAELTLGKVVHIRGGYYGDRKFTENYVTWGLGLSIPQAKLTLGFAMRIEVGPMDRPVREDKPEGNSRILNTFGFDFHL